MYFVMFVRVLATKSDDGGAAFVLQTNYFSNTTVSYNESGASFHLNLCVCGVQGVETLAGGPGGRAPWWGSGSEVQRFWHFKGAPDMNCCG